MSQMVLIVIGAIVIMLVLAGIFRRNNSSVKMPKQSAINLSPKMDAFVNWLCLKIHSQLGVDPRSNPAMLKRIQDAALETRERLMSLDNYEVSLPFLTADAEGPKHFKIVVTKEDTGMWK